MRLTRCPICHGRISLEALVQDEAGRELLALVARLDTETGAALVSYLGLFRSASRDLANERALKLARETLAINLSKGPPHRLFRQPIYFHKQKKPARIGNKGTTI